MSRDFYCKRCSLQFGKKYVFDLHLSLVHGEKIEVKSEPLIFEENLQGIQISEKEFSNQVKNEQPIYEENFEESEGRNEPICEENLQEFQKSEKESSNQVQNEQLINKENFEVKKEPICEENLVGIQIDEKELSIQVKKKQTIYRKTFEELEVKNEPLGLSNKTFQNHQMKKETLLRGHSTTTWTNFDPILTPSPPRVDKCGHSTYPPPCLRG